MKFVTLNIQINAWLDCSHPFISLHNKQDGDLMAYFNSEKINSLIDNGEITVEDLQSNDVTNQMETITTLLSIKQQDAIFRRLQDTRFTFKQRIKNSPKAENIQTSNSRKPSQEILFPFISLNTA